MTLRVGRLPAASRCSAWTSHRRKNWLFSYTVKGAQASANLYSLVETAKANGLEPYHYLRTVFALLSHATTVDDIERLLPWNIDRDTLARRP